MTAGRVPVILSRPASISPTRLHDRTDCPSNFRRSRRRIRQDPSRRHMCVRGSLHHQVRDTVVFSTYPPTHTPHPPCPRIPSHPPHIRTNALYEFTCPHMSGMNLNQPGCFCACTDVAGELIQRTSRDTGAKPPPPIRDCSQKKKSKKKSKKNWRAPRSAAGRRLLTPSGPVYHRPLVGTVVELADYPWKHRGFCLGQLRCPPPRTDETPRPRRTRMP